MDDRAVRDALHAPDYALLRRALRDRRASPEQIERVAHQEGYQSTSVCALVRFGWAFSA